MVKFSFEIPQPNTQYIQISALFQTTEKLTILQLPSWRPGRYELGNFAKNVRNFKVFDSNNVPLEAKKIAKDRWVVETEGLSQITVKYGYYGKDLNAGSTFLNNEQLYVNPVNCCVYTEESFESEIELILNVPSYWKFAGSLKERNGVYVAPNFDALFDSPFICSGQLQHRTYESGGTLFHVWFNGEVKPDWDRLINDFKRFTDSQIGKFLEFPVAEYHFLNQILPYRAYHGVEHKKSTVITLGPSYEVFGDMYKELLGVSSHELYHTWNVKTIRPIEMHPYDFSKENYSRLGYICEGVTTYMGDLFLLKSGVFNDDQYFFEFNRQLQKHFDNHGRFSYSVADSSFDTWLDGYEAGAPGRKVSIYTEGCLLAFVTDVRILRATGNKAGLDDVMKRLYFDFALQGKGVSELDYKTAIEEISGESFDVFFDDYINGTRPYESILTDSLDYLGLELAHVPSPRYSEGRLGFKTLIAPDGISVVQMYPGGPAETAGLMLEDKIVAVNGFMCNGELDKWLSYFDDDTKTVLVERKGQLLEFTFPEVNRNFYNLYSVKRTESPNNLQVRSYEHWKK